MKQETWIHARHLGGYFMRDGGEILYVPASANGGMSNDEPAIVLFDCIEEEDAAAIRALFPEIVP